MGNGTYSYKVNNFKFEQKLIAFKIKINFVVSKISDGDYVYQSLIKLQEVSNLP